MSFRKRNVVLSGSGGSKSAPSTPQSVPALQFGVRPSPLDGRLTTSTGTQTLDDLLGGHAGLPLGHSLLIEENGTTDFAGAVLRFYAAEGLVQGHQVHVVGVGEQWGRDLPGHVGAAREGGAEEEAQNGVDREKMKIAWRYEKLGEFGTGREGTRASPAPNRGPSAPVTLTDSADTTTSQLPPQPFIHAFDLTKRLTPPPGALPINYIPIPTPTTTTTTSTSNPYTPILTSLTTSLKSTPPHTTHRLILPTLLSPALYPTSSTNPTTLLPFLHSLRVLLRAHPSHLTAFITLPLSLHPRSQGLTRWIEHLSDGVLELSPFPYSIDLEGSGPASTSGGTGGKEEKAQGMVKVHKLPVVTERGSGSGMGGDDLSFSLSRRRFVVRPFHLPPVLGDLEGQSGHEGGMPKKGDIEF